MRRRYFEGLWEYHDGSCFFDNDALAEYEKLASSTKPLMTGHLVGDIGQDIEFRLGRTRAKPADPDRVRKADGGPLVVWKAPVKDHIDKNGDMQRAHRYVLAVDSSSGKGEDYTALQVLDVETFEQVAEMQVKIPPEQAAEVAYKLGRVYNDALVVCEITGGWGFAVDQKLRRELKYKNPYTRHVLDRISKRFTDKAGFDTTRNTRPLILAALEEAVRERELGLFSLRAVGEMGSFVISDSGKPEARQGAHDDLVLSLAMAVWVCQTQPKQLRKLRDQPHRPGVGRRPATEVSGFVPTPPHPNIDQSGRVAQNPPECAPDWLEPGAQAVRYPDSARSQTMSYPLTLNKAQSQAAPYNYIWTTRGTRTVVQKYIGTSTYPFEGADDTEALRKINAHEGERSQTGHSVH
jgi:hypothetical protein